MYVLYCTFVLCSSSYLEQSGHKDSVRHQVAKMSDRMGGRYSLRAHRGLPRQVGRNVAENREVFVTPKHSLPYLHVRDRKFLGRERVRLGKEAMSS